MRPVLAWHFVGAALRDGNPVPADGETLVHYGPVQLCESGLHASRSLLDAARYAPTRTRWICRVRCGGEVHEAPDKLVCTERTILWRVDLDAGSLLEAQRRARTEEEAA